MLKKHHKPNLILLTPQYYYDTKNSDSLVEVEDMSQEIENLTFMKDVFSNFEKINKLFCSLQKNLLHFIENLNFYVKDYVIAQATSEFL